MLGVNQEDSTVNDTRAPSCNNENKLKINQKEQITTLLQFIISEREVRQWEYILLSSIVINIMSVVIMNKR